MHLPEQNSTVLISQSLDLRLDPGQPKHFAMSPRAHTDMLDGHMRLTLIV